MNLGQLRGLILEEVVLELLRLVGYRRIKMGEEDTRAGPAGLEVQGRGGWHQADAFAAWDHTPAFMFPLRLVLEAKCYRAGSPVGLDVIRNVVGVIKDLSENYFSFNATTPDHRVAARRFNYLGAVFSASNYTVAAQRYGIAHQVFLIQYEDVPVMVPVIQGIHGLLDRHVASSEDETATVRGTAVRLWLREQFDDNDGRGPSGTGLSSEGETHLRQHVIRPLREIRGSYFGTLSGSWPMHLLSTAPLPAEAFASRDVVACELRGRGSGPWAFAPSGVRPGSPGWFQLEFDLPDQIAELMIQKGQDSYAVAKLKKRYASFLDVVGIIGDVRRSVRLELDQGWLESYLQERRGRSRSKSAGL